MLFVKLNCPKCNKLTYHHLRKSIHETDNQNIVIEVLCLGHNTKDLIEYRNLYEKITLPIKEFSNLETREINDVFLKHHET